MSTILKALRRLEQEKSTQSDRPLGEAVAGAAPAPAPQATPSRRWPMFAGLAIGVLVLGAAAFAAIRWSGGEEESAPVEVAAVPVTPEDPAAKARARNPAAPVREKANTPNAKRLARQARNRRAAPSDPAALPGDVAAADVTDTARNRRTPASSPGASRTPAAAGTSTAAKQPAPPPFNHAPVIDLSQLAALQAAARVSAKAAETIASAPVLPASAEAPPPAEPAPSASIPKSESKSLQEAAPVEVAVARPAPKKDPTPAPNSAKTSAPPPNAVSKPKVEPPPEPEVKSEAPRSFARKSPPRPSSRPSPKVYVSKTVWHPDASRRVAYVELDGRDGAVALREGESIGPLVVTEIAPTSVSFDHRGNELTRRVGAR